MGPLTRHTGARQGSRRAAALRDTPRASAEWGKCSSQDKDSRRVTFYLTTIVRDLVRS
jgi:hypothetical protein